MASRILLPSLRRPILPPFTISPLSSSTTSTASTSTIPAVSSTFTSASFFTTRSRRVVACTLTSLVTAHFFVGRAQSIRLDGFAVGNAGSSGGASIGEGISDGIRNYASKARNPVVTEKGRVNPAVFRQVSTGSILGLTTGALLSFFSKPLAILLGIAAIGLHFLDRKGIHLVPYSRIQNYMGDIDVKTAMVDNVAFKLSFGVTCALAGFASF